MCWSTSPEVCAEPFHDELIHHPNPKEAFCSTASKMWLWWCQGLLSNVLSLCGSLNHQLYPRCAEHPEPHKKRRVQGCGCSLITPGCCLAVPHPPAALGLFLLAFPSNFSLWFRIALWICYLAFACAWFLLAICLTWAVLVQVLLNTLMLQNRKKKKNFYFQSCSSRHLIPLGHRHLGEFDAEVPWVKKEVFPFGLGRFGWLYNPTQGQPTPVLSCSPGLQSQL